MIMRDIRVEIFNYSGITYFEEVQRVDKKELTRNERLDIIYQLEDLLDEYKGEICYKF